MNRLYILSSGAGGVKYLTQEALDALKDSVAIVSYRKYAEELKDLIVGKKLHTSGMTQEIERCQDAINLTKEGNTTSIISNGDVNVFGMATLIVELIDEQNLWDKIELISIAGVTSFLATASRIGAPISQDFAIISLSDRLTDINMIDKRVKNSLDADFILGIYNPLSKTRIEPYKNFLKALKEVDKRVVIIASNVGRKNEEIRITDSYELVTNITQYIKYAKITMSTLIIVGNSNTKLTKNGLVLTPRGYLNKYETDGKPIIKTLK